jgi:hypothetical protein
MIVSCKKHCVLIRLGTTWRVPRTTHNRPSHFRDSVEINRHQLPLAVNFASTAHRVQGDTLDRVLVNMRSPMFAHGQLYTAITRVRVRKNIFLRSFLVPPIDFSPAAGCTPALFVCRNIVFTSILRYCPAVRHALHAVFLASDAFQASSATRNAVLLRLNVPYMHASYVPQFSYLLPRQFNLPTPSTARIVCAGAISPLAWLL